MQKGKNIHMKAFVIIILTTLLIGSSLQVIGTQHETNSNQEIGSWRVVVEINNPEDKNYEGFLKVFVVEPVSRWNNYNGNPYHYGFLDFAIEDTVNVEDHYLKNVTWNPDPTEVESVDPDNLMIIAVLFNTTPHEQDAYQNRPFDAYYTDAVAATIPGEIGYNTPMEGFTHTVFAEEGTATWCPACPLAAEALYDIYESGDYPFYFVAHVSDKNKVAANRLNNDYNLGAYPTTFFDGGNIVEVGSGSSIKHIYENDIRECGQRQVENLSLSAHLYWDPDESPPTVTITKPGLGLYVMNEKKLDLNQTIIIGTMDIEVEASDLESEIVNVDFYINDHLIKNDTISPYKYSNWKESKIFGRYTIKVVAYDEAGNYGSDEINVIRFF